jgi:hypothetical protein
MTKKPATSAGITSVQTMLTKNRAESGQGGPCLTDAARGAALGRAVRGVPLRRGPNVATAIIAAVLARWRHVLSFVFHRAGAISGERVKRLSPHQRCQSLPGCGVRKRILVMAGHSRSKNGVASLAYVPAIHALLAEPPEGRRGCPHARA